MDLSLSVGGILLSLSSCTFIYQRTYGWDDYAYPDLLCKVFTLFTRVLLPAAVAAVAAAKYYYYL